MFLRRTPNRIRTVLVLATAAVCSIVLWSPAGQAAGKTETLRFHFKDVSMTIIHADGTVVGRPPYPEPTAGDVVEVNALDYRGDSRHHAAKWTASHSQRCVVAEGPPDCQITVAVGGSLLIFRGERGTLVNGTGRYQGATGRVLSVKEAGDGSDVVARIKLR
jgi:hypothetical protein